MGDYTSFTHKINEKFDIDLSLYKEAQMKRRLTSLRNKRGYADFSAYFNAICKNDELLKEFLDRLTINVSEFYRNPKRWDVLRSKVLPELTKNKKKLTIWSAACSTGDEPYSLSIMLKEHFNDIDVSIIATDIDENVLKKAKQGVYNASALKELPEHKKSKYFLFKNNKYYVNEQLKSIVTFKKHNLLNDPYPSNVDLIVCRNVLIYFTDPAKNFIYERFGQALNQNGFLFVGSTEQIFNPNNFQLSLYDTFFYQKKS
ncbi:protein-glutamate O-methyltransferase CheR [Pseudogracilibacillus sp. SE30717A]|uniref:CheR family methyltransferase n=1 Tax=Pseudogracilibacillus sp. SE30717A TaxID=3098293 RepID=UPI00300DD0B4